MMATLLALPAAMPTRADEMILQSSGTVPRSANVVPQGWNALSLPADRGGVAAIGRQPWGVAPAVQTPELASYRGVAPGWNRPPRTPLAVDWERPVRLPSVEPTIPQPDDRSDTMSHGSVYGRLSNRKRPLVNCRTVLVPLVKKGKGHTIDGDGKPISAVTDERGRYYIDSVPPGEYKLYWLPARTNRWIHRIEVRPDVVVGKCETKQIKDIRIALTTVNK